MRLSAATRSRLGQLAGFALAAAIAAVSLAVAGRTPPPARYTNVILIPEENHVFGQVIGSANAPYINSLANVYGLATHYEAAYPADLPYLTWLQGTSGAITTDCGPIHCPQPDTNLLHALASRGRQWRIFAESMPSNCFAHNTGAYVPRHAPGPYFTDERRDCRRWDVPFAGTSNTLTDALTAGTLAPFTMITPDLRHDMHDGTVAQADTWLRIWIPRILTGRNYRSGHTVLIIAWDEGSHTNNHVPLIVISPTTHAVKVTGAFGHPSLSRLLADLVGVPPLHRAQRAPSMNSGFHLK